MSRPTTQDYPSFYHTYVSKVEGEQIKEILKQSLNELQKALSSIPADKEEYSYAEAKWSVKELLQHCVDTERIFAYRALCFARGEKQSLPGFDENDYSRMASVVHRKLSDLIEEWLLIRKSSIALFESFTPEMLSSSGVANGNSITVNSIGFIIAGHGLHHIKILAERYL
jgi:DinB superfamily